VSRPQPVKSVVAGTAGHIDHGKSALVLALTGTDPDRLKEEKARGITIDLGFAHAAIGELNVAFVDVPGHERFVKNMLAGAGGIDLVVLVVAADESVMPQTREHFDICRLLGVPAGVVALTKADLADADTLELTRLEVRELVAGSFLDGAPIVPVSAKTGAGLDELRAALVAAAGRVRGRPVDTVARLPIDRVFSMKGFGTVATGTLVSGRIAVEDELALLPGGRRVTVRGVQVHGAAQKAAVAGQRTAINLGGVDVHEVARGQTVVTPAAFETTRVADATIDLLPGAKALKHGARVRFHQGTAEVLGRVSLVGPASAQALQPGSRGFVRLRLEEPAILARGDRYILRAYSPTITIAGGSILDPRPPRSAVRTEAALARCRRLDFDFAAALDRPAAELAAAKVMIDEAGGAGLPVASLVTRAAIDPASVDRLIDALAVQRIAVRAGTVLVACPIVAALEAAILDALKAHHQAQPLSEGLPREEARERLFRRGHAAVFDKAIDALVARQAIVARDRLALAGHRLALSPDEDRVRAALERLYQEAGLKPPELSSVPGLAGAPAPLADRMLKLLQRQKVLVKVDALVFHEQALKQLKADVAALKGTGESSARIDVGTFKERFGVTRKFAIPLLEYLDRERVTRRVGDARIIL
jgi:selenocysteine-specific elongation factor